ncbi:MAG: aspartate dehydrogenase [Methanomassiliicoccus sp.]|nr:aspartate dehydrogenase [Methanomassiliicoccus sp.]
MRILIIGCGSIGSVLATAVQDMPEVDRIYVTDQSKDFAVHLIEDLDKAEYIDNENGKLSKILGEIDLAVEAASQDAARRFIPFALENGVDVMVMSVGVFADDAFRERCFTLAKRHRSRIYVPSGSICGTDGLHSASAAGISEVHLTTRKGPKGLKGAPGLAQRGIDVDALTEATVVFEGNARDAASQFPKNLNVAATVSLLGVGFDQTRVTIICDPTTERNAHTLVVKGEFGELKCETHNVPSPRTPSTSYLAALSAVAAIKRILGNVWIGV